MPKSSGGGAAIDLRTVPAASARLDDGAFECVVLRDRSEARTCSQINQTATLITHQAGSASTKAAGDFIGLAEGAGISVCGEPIEPPGRWRVR